VKIPNVPHHFSSTQGHQYQSHLRLVPYLFLVTETVWEALAVKAFVFARKYQFIEGSTDAGCGFKEEILGFGLPLIVFLWVPSVVQ
jgi:hypothetical protein